MMQHRRGKHLPCFQELHKWFSSDWVTIQYKVPVIICSKRLSTIIICYTVVCLPDVYLLYKLCYYMQGGGCQANIPEAEAGELGGSQCFTEHSSHSLT